jgi:hypothetical protein
MNGNDAANLYNAIKLHFTSEKYNAITYRFKTKSKFVPENQFFIFQKLGKMYGDNLIHYYVSNLSENPKLWVMDLLSDDCETRYKSWKKRNDSLSYVYKNEIGTLLDEYPLNELILVKGTYPLLMVKTMQEIVSLDTLLLTDSILQFFNVWNMKIKERIVWEPFRMKCDKYRSFMNIDLPKFKNILKEEVKCRS